MKNSNHPIDDLFREALAEHIIVPSDGARKAFLKDAATLPATGNKRKKGLIWLSGLSFLAILGFGTWLLLSTTSRENYLVKEKMPASIPTLPVTHTIHNTPENAAKPRDISSEPTGKITTARNNKPAITGNKQTLDVSLNETILSPQPAPPDNKSAATAYQTSAPAETSSPEPNITPATLPPLMNDPGEKDLNETKPPQKILQKFDSVALKSTRSDSLADILNVLPVSDEKKSRNRGKLNTTLGIYYAPEWMFNTLEGGKFVHNFGLEGVFHYGPFSVKTGAGISVSKGTNEVSVEYNDYLGAYNKLDSMDFTWNDPSHQYTPTYYLSRQDVWDSLLKIDNAKVIKRYTYLQIPLIFGYDFMENERFSFGIRVGPTMSVLLKTKQLSEEYDPGKKRIIRVNDISPTQIDLNWQVMAGLNGAVRLSPSVKFEVEPSVRYYFNSAYEKPVNYTKPWSIGIKGGFLIDL